MRRFVATVGLCLGLCLAAGTAGAEVAVKVLYAERVIEHPPVLSNLDPVPEDLGRAGAELGIRDSATTGRFLGHAYALEEVLVDPDADLATALAGALAGHDLIVANMPAEDLLALSALAPGALILNAGAPDDRLRRADCRANVLHSLPSRAMLADALAQFLVVRRWDELFLIEGNGPGDAAWAQALRNAAGKFGLEIVEDRRWPHDADMRRSAASEVPRFTQGDDHDVVLIADEIGDFGRYVLYHTWEPRPVAGSEGLVPTGWDRVVEQWGAAQLNSRFQKRAKRPMQARDHAAWAAVRSIAEAVTRTGRADAASVRDYLLGDAFELAAFKGRALSYRPWNGQLRQPIPLVHSRALVAMAPFEKFLHPVSELDTLGADRRGSGCTAFD